MFLLDLDGVLANFTQAMIDTHKWPIAHDEITTWDMWETFGMTEDEAWEPTKDGKWWLSIEPYPWASDLVKRLSKLGEVTFCTSPNLDPTCASQKVQWLIKHGLMHPKKNNYFIGKKKYMLAKSGAKLIDDSGSNCISYWQHGGEAILFPQAYNANRNILADKVDWVIGHAG